MAYQDISNENAAAFGMIAQALGPGAVVMGSPQRVCDSCGAVDGAAKSGGGEHWVFPYHATDRNGRTWTHLCNPCHDALGCPSGASGVAGRAP